MTDKQIIKKFSDNHCLVLENNQISLREDEITAYRIVLGKSTNELLEFVKDIYLQLKAKEEECKRLKKELSTYGATGICEVCTDKSVLQNDKYTKALIEIKEIAKKQCVCGVDCIDMKQILQKISEVE